MYNKSELKNEVIKDMTEQINKVKRSLKRIREQSDTIGIASNILRHAIKVRQWKDMWHTMRPSYYNNTMFLGVNMYIENMKAPDFIRFMEWIEKDIGEFRESYDSAGEYEAFRTFELSVENINLTINCHLKTNGEYCTRVRTGVELIEKPMYELRCN